MFKVNIFVQNSKMYRGVLEGELENGENIGRHSDSHINTSPYNTYIVVKLINNLLCLSVIYPTEMVFTLFNIDCYVL